MMTFLYCKENIIPIHDNIMQWQLQLLNQNCIKLLEETAMKQLSFTLAREYNGGGGTRFLHKRADTIQVDNM